MIVNKIYSYYVNIGWATQAPVVDLWKEKWKAEGWEAIVLGETDARKDPRWDDLQRRVRELPCRPGAKGFERTCFERWLAFAQIDGPAAVADFDVFPIRHFPPQDFGKIPMCGDGAGGPGFVVGQPEDFSRIVDVILEYKADNDDDAEGNPHVSDMTVLRKRQGFIYRIAVYIITYGMPNFGTVPLAHYGNASLDKITNNHTGMPKAEAIRHLLAEHYQK